MRTLRALLAVILLGGSLLTAPAAGAAEGSRTLVFRLRISGQIAIASWTTCPEPVLGAVCTDTDVLAFDTKAREGKERERGPVVRVLTFVYRIVPGEDGGLSTTPVAEWFGRIEGGTVTGTPRLRSTTTRAVVPVLICGIFEPGNSCPEQATVNVRWTGTGPLTRIDEHAVLPGGIRKENTWTRGWSRDATASGTVNGSSPGTPVDATMLRVDQGEVIVQHPLP